MSMQCSSNAVGRTHEQHRRCETPATCFPQHPKACSVIDVVVDGNLQET